MRSYQNINPLIKSPPILNKLRDLFFGTLIFILLLTQTSFASLVSDESKEGANRIRQCIVSPAGDSTPEEVRMVDSSVASSAADVTLDFNNPACATDVLGTYIAFKVVLSAANKACQGQLNIRVLPSLFQDIKDMSVNTYRAGSQRVPSCIGTAAATAAPFAALNVVLGTKYAIAQSTFRNSRICGYGWSKSNPTNYDKSTPGYKQVVKDKIDQYILNDKSKLNMDNKAYREWYYGGMEFADHVSDSNDICYDVMDSSLCGNSSIENCTKFPRQKYYMRGFQHPNFNCEKYNVSPGQDDPLTQSAASPERLTQIKKAYDCCTKRSREYICIEYSPLGLSNLFCEEGQECDVISKGVADELTLHKFCKAGENCDIAGIVFSAEYEKTSNKGIVCAGTYSLCPFNFNISGGSTICDYFKDGIEITQDGEKTWQMVTALDIESGECAGKSELRDANCKIISNKAGKCRNYCQYMNHCVKTSASNFQYNSSITSPYFSSACLNFVGDSRNVTSINGSLIGGSQRHFTAPIAQCVKETIENVFYNRAGHTRCQNLNEVPGSDGSCYSGEYVYKKGEIAPLGKKSFFSFLQESMVTIVQLTLVLSISFYGAKILLGMQGIDRKELVMYVLKIGIILYFAVGTAWQTFFFNGVYNASTAISNIIYKIEVSNQDNKRDGCQFGNVTKTFDGTQITAVSSSYRSYPAGKEYLAIWDTLDCKLARYLGFGPEASVANLALLIAMGYLTGPIGIYFTVLTMIFGIFFIVMAMRALHIFLASAISIIILIYISPIIITLTLFKRTDMLKNWLSNLISFIMQPIILFAYIAIVVMVLDRILIGSATFEGTPPNRIINCNEVCQSNDGTITPKTSESGEDFCSQQGDIIVDPMTDSIACILTSSDTARRPGLEIFGITINVLKLLDHNALEKILTLMKGALILYLLAKFIDEIPAITTALVGGSALPASKANLENLAGGAASLLRNIQKRGARAIKKTGGKAGSFARSKLNQAGKRKDAEEKDSTSKPEGQESSGDITGRSNAANSESKNDDKK